MLAVYLQTIYVIDPDIQFGSQEHGVKVLDCDSISQVKDKILDAIYKNAPYSSRPLREELDLGTSRIAVRRESNVHKHLMTKRFALKAQLTYLLSYITV